MTITQHMVFAWLAALFWPWTRLTGLIMTAPLLGSKMAPVQVRVLLSLTLAGSVAAWDGPWPPLPHHGYLPAVMLYGGLNIVYGALLGLAAQVIIYAVAAAGEIGGLAIGLGFARLTGLDQQSEPPVLYNFYEWAGLMVWLGLGGPFLLIRAVTESFHGVPGGLPALGSLHGFAQLIGLVISSGLTIALPAVAAAFALNLVTGIANILSPQFNIFSVGFPLLFLGGVFVIGMSLFYIEPVTVESMTRLTDLLGHLVHGRV